MKLVYVIRHADKNRETGELTDIGRKRAKELKEKLGTFNMVITSDKNSRLIETAQLLTGMDPQIDKRAGIMYHSEEQHQKLGALAKNHPLSHAGAIYEHTEFKDLATFIGNNLLVLIQETLDKLPETGVALIVSQDGCMVAAEHILLEKPYRKLEKAFKPLEGFTVDENLRYEELKV